MQKQAATRCELPKSITQWPNSLQFEYEERAAIKEHDGKMTKAEAERQAEAEIRELFREL